MEISPALKKIKELISKYRYGLLVIAVGIFLMVLPEKRTEDVPLAEETEIVSEVSVESRLSQILSLVDGAGETQVLLTVFSGEETIYQVDESVQKDTESSDTKITTITITNREKAETGLIRQVIPPTYLGAIVVCRGGDDPTVKLAVVEAVSKVTGLGADQISVLKMK